MTRDESSKEVSAFLTMNFDSMSARFDAIETHKIMKICVCAVWEGKFFRDLHAPESELELRTGTTWRDIEVLTENWVEWGEWPNDVTRQYFTQRYHVLVEHASRSHRKLHPLDTNFGTYITRKVRAVALELVWGFNRSLEVHTWSNVEKNCQLRQEWERLISYQPKQVEEAISAWITYMKAEKTFLFN